MEGRKVQLFLPDASIVVKWFINEEQSDKAREIKKRYTDGKVNLIAPRLLEYEAVNALRFHPIVKLSERELFLALSSVRRLAIMTDPPEGTWVKAIELSLTEGISVYDAVYLALADASRGKMVTTDTTLRDRLSETARKKLVLLAEVDDQL